MRPLRQVEDALGLVQVRHVRGLMSANAVLQLEETIAPLRGLTLVLLGRQDATQAIHVSLLDPALEPLGFRLQRGHALAVIFLFALEAFPKSLPDLSKGRDINREVFQGLPELGDEIALGDVGTVTDLALVPPSRAAIVNVGPMHAVLLGFLMEFRRNGRATVPAFGESGERELLALGLGLLTSENRLHAIKEGLGDQRLVLAHHRQAIPLDQAVVERIGQDAVDTASPNRLPVEGMLKPLFLNELGHVPNRVATRGIELVGLVHQRALLRVYLDFPGRHVVQIPGRRNRRESPLLHLLVHPLRDFLGEVVDVVPGQDHLDIQPEFFRRFRVLGKMEVLFEEVGLFAVLLDEIVHPHEIVVIAGHAIRFLEDHGRDIRMGPDEHDHLGEAFTVLAFGRLGNGPGFDDLDSLSPSVFNALLALGIDRIPLLLLLFGGDPDVEDAFHHATCLF